MGYKAIGDYGAIGDMLSMDLVGIDGSIDWCCLPRFDSELGMLLSGWSMSPAAVGGL